MLAVVQQEQKLAARQELADCVEERLSGQCANVETRRDRDRDGRRVGQCRQLDEDDPVEIAPALPVPVRARASSCPPRPSRSTSATGCDRALSGARRARARVRRTSSPRCAGRPTRARAAGRRARGSASRASPRADRVGFPPSRRSGSRAAGRRCRGRAPLDTRLRCVPAPRVPRRLRTGRRRSTCRPRARRSHR